MSLLVFITEAPPTFGFWSKDMENRIIKNKSVMENFKKCSIVLFIVFSLSSCDDNKKNFFVDSKTFDIEDLKISKLEGTVMQFNDTIWNPVRINVIDTLLFLGNRSTEYVFDIYNLKNNTKINECLKIGQGPDDFVYPQIVQSAGDNVWIYDMQLTKAKEFTVSDLLESNLPVSKNIISLNNMVLRNVAVLSDGAVLASVNSRTRGGFNLYNPAGLLLDSIGDYPELTSGTLSDIEKLMSFQCRFATNLTDRIFLSYSFSDLIEVYDFKGKCINRMHGPHRRQLKMGLRSSGEVTGAAPIKGETYHCYSSPVYAGNEVFVSYFGELSENFEGQNDKIIVFDWNGKPLRMYELDTPIFTFTVDHKNKIIYGITNSPEYMIIKFNY